MTARDANQTFSKLLADVERGETVLITKNGKTVAELRPRAQDSMDDPAWRANFERMLTLMNATPATGYRVGEITDEDKYGDAPQ
jgi:prevent-host-death family protein